MIMTHLIESAKQLCISAWKYGYKFSNSSVYNEKSVNLVELTQEINVNLSTQSTDEEKLNIVQTKITALEQILDNLQNLHPNQLEYIKELKLSVKEFTSALALGGQVQAA